MFVLESTKDKELVFHALTEYVSNLYDEALFVGGSELLTEHINHVQKLRDELRNDLGR